MLSAADTFRAAAADQLEIWAKRAGADIVRHGEGADPAAVVFDSISAAKARGSDIIIVDTAGRLHNKANLMNELAKIDRVISRELPDASRETLTVRGECEGELLRENHGAGGFGYDPLFYVEKYGCTFGELPAEVKNTISHRANALNKLKEALKDKI